MDEKESKAFVQAELQNQREDGAFVVINDLTKWLRDHKRISRKSTLKFISEELKKISEGRI